MDDQEVLDSGNGGRGARWVVVAAGVFVVLLAAVTAWPRTAGMRSADSPTSSAATPTPSVPASAVVTARAVTPGIWIGVERADEDRLPRLETLLPDKLSLNGATPLSTAPMAQALALFQRGGKGDPGPVLALGDDGGLRELDNIELASVTDGHNEQSALDDTALSPDGRMAAFPQRDEVVVVDLTDATSRRWPVPGFNEIVSWRPDGVTLVVEQQEAVYLVDSETGRVSRAPYPGFGTVAGGEPGTDLYRLHTPSSQVAELTRWDTSGTLLSRMRPRLAVGTGEWWGTGWLRGGRIAGDVFGAGGPRPYADVIEAEVIVVLDAETGQLAAGLVLPGIDRWKGCCQVMGWYDEDTVLFASRGRPSRLLAWRVSRGELLRVADLPDNAMVALGDLRRG
ncbi:hypothetical protein [Planotetraspora kaengkrachanensis]|uniref:Uncharacterized protein n=1 Tax=Planotetraspora kaengkrachanensis TaxID=575193 RepID=A0A8J3PW91_9ACTN|nr:hypothetical protein [Planotetraspora kaengkrachanensis]GIG82246.1 hypothetical protein Pka01_53730 [Planotetraspora kaengkrachanensis]